jgi:hypothetical protein
VALFILTLASGLSLAQEPQPLEVSGEDDLEKVKGRFQLTYVSPDADIALYDKIYAWNVVYQFRDVGEGRKVSSTVALLQSGNQGPFAVPEEDQEKFGELVRKALLKELGRSKKFELVDEIGPDTLLMRAAFLDIVSQVPPNRTGTVDVHITKVGEATLVFDLIDAETGVIQARVGERRAIQPPAQMYQVSSTPATDNTIWADVGMWASDVARDLRVALDKARKKADKK